MVTTESNINIILPVPRFYKKDGFYLDKMTPEQAEVFMRNAEEINYLNNQQILRDCFEQVMQLTCRKPNMPSDNLRASVLLCQQYIKDLQKGIKKHSNPYKHKLELNDKLHQLRLSYLTDFRNRMHITMQTLAYREKVGKHI
ncbi:hypothetical protein AHMF7605_11845 [Adhaeribacter arboris]|uniref:Uncharacterized protein n=1 Tax=Adhaeribacter arboris TaxID=2072846 RepID=A0A2T2YF86_9BACT|nr:hypothetical protein [Adhaeribacter arboris]PSR54164.1 hypothetical protein AHMF7605_11845 [Adhaeribacter arboris]